MSEKKPKRVAPTSMKGMRDIMGDEYYTYQGFFEKAQEIAMYYGFSPIEMPLVEDEELYLRGVGEHTDILEKEMYTLRPPKSRDKLALRPEGTAGAMRAYIEHGMQSLPQPVMLYYYGPFYRHDKPQRGRYRELRQFGLEILGTHKSINDALIIKMTMLILKEAGMHNPVVDINSIGDADSRKEYIKVLTAYYRKFINDLPPVDRERLKTNPLRILDSKEKKTIEINEEAPDSISFLGSTSKKHFKEVLEYLEEMGISYRINKSLVRGLDYYSDTVFEISEEGSVDSEGNTLPSLSVAGGGRYDGLSKAIGHRKEIPGVGVGIGVDRVVHAACCSDIKPRIFKKPKAYFIQIGVDAKLRSLGVIEILREAKISIQHSLAKDKLSVQLAIAEKLEIPYTLIFGQKEAIDKTIIVRNMQTRSQKTVDLSKLKDYMKKLK
ncbi:MAG: histidyl-tRNA synthetase [Flavobacteriaceae bacterium]|jgi:histidyl-tRNA synthetase